MTGNAVADGLRDRLRRTSGRERVGELFAFMKQRGESNYDESVTQIEHALQCAELAAQRRIGDPAVTAALLHDIGHLLVDEHEGREDFLRQDMSHETIGANLLDEFFPPEVTEPIRLHVPAKRYLCTTDPEYYAKLSDASKRSYEVQGGELSPAERAELEGNPELAAALELRRIDDLGKSRGKTTPSIEAYADAVVRCLR